MAQNHSTITNPSAFPLGAPNDAYAKYFIGQSYLAPLVSGKEVNVSNVTFEVGCRNNWHIHHRACQILIAVGGAATTRSGARSRSSSSPATWCTWHLRPSTGTGPRRIPISRISPL